MTVSIFQPSEYQLAIFEWMRDGSGHGIVNAVAGSGKSTTLEQGVKGYIPCTNRILNMAFNRHIKEAMAKKMPRNVEVATFNAFGWGICRRNVRGITLEGRKNTLILNTIVNPDLDRARYFRLRKPVLQMVSLLKALGDHNIAKWQEASKTYSVEMGEIKQTDRFEDVLNELYTKSVECLDLMDFDDQVFQPIYRGWELPVYDNMLIDEAQDCSPVQIELCTRMANQGGRITLVGDPDQSIYLFRGAHPDAMKELAGILGAVELPLNLCYRCPDAVIEAAQKIVPRIQAPVPNPNGRGIEETVKTEEFVRDVEEDDMVLCRTTAPLIKRCLQLLRMGRKAYVKGRDLVEQVILLVEQLHGDPQVLQRDVANFRQYNRVPTFGVPIEEFLERLRTYRTSKLQLLEKQGRDAEAQALEDRCDTVEAFAEDSRFVAEIIIKVEDVTGEEGEGVVLMTGHKCKGLEARNVWILRPDLLPHPKSKTDIALRQENNLEYVMITRSRWSLRWVQKEDGEK